MAKKSKFWTFVLSFVPGLGHVYLGYSVRGLIFFASVCFTGMVAGILGNSLNMSGGFLAIFIPIIWFAGMVDSLNLAEKINSGKISYLPSMESESESSDGNDYIDKQNKKIITMLLSIIPGAGHMFIGLQRQGLEFMSVFFFTVFFIDWLNISILMFLVPIIWFYNLFDILKKISSKELPEDDDIIFISWFDKGGNWFKDKNKTLGYGFIIVGAVLLFEKIVLPWISKYVSWEFRNYFETGVVALLFIAGGIRLIAGNRIDNDGDKEDKLQCDN